MKYMPMHVLEKVYPTILGVNLPDRFKISVEVHRWCVTSPVLHEL
jgi:hypothetical protein